MNLLLLFLFTAFFHRGGGPGNSVLPVLQTGQGARIAAMGEAGIGLADDGCALYWNPAGLGNFSDFSLALSHQEWFGDTRDELLHTVLPSGRGAFGLSLLYSATDGIEAWDEQNQPGDAFATWNGLINLGYGITLVPNYRFGIGVKAGYENLYQSHGYGGGLDLGFLAQPLSFLGIGLAGRSFGVMRYSSGIEYLPAEVGLGIAYRWENLRLALDGVLPLDNEPNFRLGVEYLPVPVLALRLGYRTGPVDLATLNYSSGITAGLGVNLPGFSIDYALTPYGKLGAGHRLTIALRLPRQGQGSLHIQVIDRETATPLWAMVSISGVRNLQNETNRKGELFLTRLPAGQLVIKINRNGYLPRVDTMLILGNREQSAVIALQPIKYATVIGTVYDAVTAKPLPGNIAYQGMVYGEEQTDPVLGTFAIRTIPAGKYIFTVRGPDGYIPQTCTLDLPAGRLVTRDFYLARRQQTLVLEGINFATGRADILPRFYPILDRAGKILKENPTLVVEIAGHTDAREINSAQFPSSMELAQARAEAVRRYLIEQFGINPERLIARGYADSQPIAPNDTEAGRAKNRRAELHIREK